MTNFAGNAVATVLIGTWTEEIDHERMEEVLSGQEPFDETDMLDEHYEEERFAREHPTGEAAASVDRGSDRTG
ncbi:MAG: hypothetical protein ACR2J5_01870 [Geodermatophilaceae bacterium]